MVNEMDFSYLVSRMRSAAKICGDVPFVGTLKNLLLEAADELEILKRKNDQIERMYAQDVICGAYVSKEAILRQMSQWAQQSPDCRVDMNSLNAWVNGYPRISKEEALRQLYMTGGREFRVWTPKGEMKVWAKMPIDHPDDYPGVYIDMTGPEGSDLLCCVEYDSTADGIYARVYADGEETTASIRFEEYD
ncbi:MAG: hypothetical protein IKJ99_03655 [Oscillospiraceae bacterium]|nr:hypothetical protein [Oscillospiraceae bacterium]